MFKKFLILIICYHFVCIPVTYAITDDFVNQTLDKTKPYPNIQRAIIIDEFIETNLEKQNLSYPLKPVITDDFAEQNTLKNKPLIRHSVVHEFIPQIDENKKHFKKIVVMDKSDYIPIFIRIKHPISTKNRKIDEGDIIDFETTSAVKVQGTTLPKGSTVKARIENISQNGMKGVPADIVIGNFKINNTLLAGEIAKTGANRSLWVYPIGYIGSAFFGAGSLLFFIRGGHAKIKRNEIYTIYLQK